MAGRRVIEVGEEPLVRLRGIGPRRCELLGRLGIGTLRDLLLHVPRAYLDRRAIEQIDTLEAGREATIVARLVRVDLQQPPGRVARLHARLADETGPIEAVWFGQPYLARLLRPGGCLLLSGPVHRGRTLQIVNPEFEILEEGSRGSGLTGGRIVPVYPLTAGISQKLLRSAVREAIDRVLPAATDLLPAPLRRRLGLPALDRALRDLHFPDRPEDAEAARRRLAFEELLLLQLFLRRLRVACSHRRGRILKVESPRFEAIRRRLPFRLTTAQERAVGEILVDLARDRPMMRLLQGDVGSGKTVVAALACATAALAGSQACFLAPTELLVLQHTETLASLLEPAGLRITRLTGRTPGAQRRRILERIAEGSTDIVVGTHALLEPDVRFRKLALVVVDEQQRFGVYQRLRIRGKGIDPHTLVMSATPIPRTLALTLFGELDATTIDEIPPGRTIVRTRLVDRARWDDLLRYVAGRLRCGEQAFFVYPLVEESASADVRDATRMWQEISRHAAFTDLKVGLLHARLDPPVREETVTAMRRGELHAVVATTVIEVGLDLPQATLMVIEHPERFGLSQLHQLRGRIGRAPGRSPYCFLIRPEEGSASPERLEVLVRESDGFRVAEEDLRLRGPGEWLGSRQAGLARMRVADLARDRDLLFEARRTAEEILAGDPGLADPSHRLLWREAVRRYPDGERLLGAG